MGMPTHSYHRQHVMWLLLCISKICSLVTSLRGTNPAPPPTSLSLFEPLSNGSSLWIVARGFTRGSPILSISRLCGSVPVLSFSAYLIACRQSAKDLISDVPKPVPLASHLPAVG
jgi:hypothetical protein